MLLYVIRHGDPIYSPDSLTPKGQRQAEAVGRRLALHGLDQIFSSPLMRAQETAKPAAEILKLPIQIEEWSSETYAWNNFTQVAEDGKRHWVFWQQNTRFRSAENIHRNADWMHCDILAEKDFSEPYKYIIDGSDAFFAKLGYERQGGIYKITRPNNDKIALFCHEGFSMIWFPFLLAIPPHLFWSSFGITHTGVSVFELANNKDGFTAPRALCINDTSHIYAERLPTMYQNKFYY